MGSKRGKKWRFVLQLPHGEFLTNRHFFPPPHIPRIVCHPEAIARDLMERAGFKQPNFPPYYFKSPTIRILDIVSKIYTKINMLFHQYFVYILTNTYNTVLYTGVTNDLERRCQEHKHKLVKGFTSKYNVDKLVYFERFDLIESAIAREKQIKGYSRVKKITLINKFNTEWKDLINDGKVKNPH